MQRSLTRVQYINTRGSSTRSLLYYRNWIGIKRKRGERRCTYTRTEGSQPFPLQWEVCNLFRQRCQRSRSNCWYKEIEESESPNSLTTWAKCKVLNLLVRNAETNFGRQSLSRHYVPVSTRRMCCKSCQRRWKRELFAKDNSSLERTKSNTPKYTGSQNSDVSSMPGETESNLKTWNLTQFHQRVAIGRTRIYKDKQYIQRIKESSSMMLRRHRRTISLPKSSSKRSTGRYTDMSILDPFPIIQ